MSEGILHFIKYGRGKQPVILFHGFGQDHKVFENLIDQLKGRYTFYAIDLYYHGESYRPEVPLTKSDWKKVFKEFLKDQNIDTCQIIGFSLGGRFALSAAVELPKNIQQVILIAPDGIYNNFWYLFATSIWGNWLFKRLMNNPEKLEKWLTFFETAHLAPKSMIRFAQKELKDRENCKRVYQSWTFFQPLQYSSSFLIKYFNTNQLPLTVILGDQDFVIPTAKILPKTNQITHTNNHVIPSKHHHMIDTSISLVSSSLNEIKL